MPKSGASWSRVRFSEMVTSAGATRKARGWTAVDGGVERYVGLEHLDANSPTIRRWGTPETVGENSDLRHFEPGDVILARRGIEQRKVGVAEFRGVASGHALVFRARPNVVLPAFLPYFLLSDVFMNRALEFSAGSLSKTVNLSALMRQEFALPPLEEQRRMATLLRSFDAVSESHAKALTSIDASERSIAYEGFESLARSTTVQALETGCLRVTDGTHQSPVFTDAGVPFFLVKTISGGTVDWSHTKFVSHETYAELTRRVRPGPGHVLYTAVGATYGVAKFVDFDSPFVFQRHIAHIIPNPEVLLGQYVELFLNSPQGKRQSDKHAIGSAQPTVTLRALSSFRMPIPSLEEQRVLVERVAQIASAKQALTDRLAEMRVARRAALTGFEA